MVVEPKNFPFLKWQHRAGAGVQAKIREKVEPELEPKINHFGSATLDLTVRYLSRVQALFALSRSNTELFLELEKTVHFLIAFIKSLETVLCFFRSVLVKCFSVFVSFLYQIHSKLKL